MWKREGWEKTLVHFRLDIINIVQFLCLVLAYVVPTTGYAICCLTGAREDDIVNISIWFTRCWTTIFEADEAMQSDFTRLGWVDRHRSWMGGGKFGFIWATDRDVCLKRQEENERTLDSRLTCDRKEEQKAGDNQSSRGSKSRVGMNFLDFLWQMKEKYTVVV